MKHTIKGRKLNRTSSHRKSLLINLASALIKHELIKTTLPKAKDLRPFIEKIFTIGKTDSLSNRRRAFSVLKSQELVNKLFTDIGQRIKDRSGGYTRIMKYGFRTGDKAPMAIIEVVDRKISSEEKTEASKKEAKKKVVNKA